MFDNYVLGKPSHLDFWHTGPEVEQDATFRRLGPYYMPFSGKASYSGPFDEDGVPMLDYGGAVGCHHNPIAIAQYGLARWNRWCETSSDEDLSALVTQAGWLADNLEENEQGIRVWTHPFAWEYREGLPEGWPSGLAQGQALSCLARAYEATGEPRFRKAAESGFPALATDTSKGGVTRFTDEGEAWIEEVIVDPPSSILNGFLWALWGVWDHYLLTGDSSAEDLFEKCVDTLLGNLHRYDTGWWSLYELSPFRVPMVASPFYHALHIAQLRITHVMTGEPLFKDYAERWARYEQGAFNRAGMFATKGLFKLLHY